MQIEASPVIVLLRTRLRPGADRAGYAALGERMFELVQTIPGFVGAASYSADGEEVGVIRFADHAALRTWRDHPEHVVAQQRGRTDFYDAYTIEVCAVVRAYGFGDFAGAGGAITST